MHYLSEDMKTDFKNWERDTLEKFAREAADENRELKEKLSEMREMRDTWRNEAIKNQKEPAK